MLYAPITRLYTETYAEVADVEKTVPYYRNKIKKPLGMSECLGYLKLWQRMWKGDTFCYEYHFMDFQYLDASNLFMSKIVYDDIRALKSQGLSGIIEDGSQRSFFPTGLQFHVYGETLFDSSRSYDDIVGDYFSHAYGAEWKKVYEYLEKISDAVPYSYYFGLNSVDEEKGKYYNPNMLQGARRMKEIVREFKPVIEANLDQEQRASSVAWQVLLLHATSTVKFAELTEHLCVGDDEGAGRVAAQLISEMSAHEIYYERYYDHYLYSRTLKRFLKDKSIIDNLSV